MVSGMLHFPPDYFKPRMTRLAYHVGALLFCVPRLDFEVSNDVQYSLTDVMECEGGGDGVRRRRWSGVGHPFWPFGRWREIRAF